MKLTHKIRFINYGVKYEATVYSGFSGLEGHPVIDQPIVVDGEEVWPMDGDRYTVLKALIRRTYHNQKNAK